jgi:transposase
VRYLGMDVHAKWTVWCLLDAQGEVAAQGRVETSAAALGALVRELSAEGELLAGQEVGTMTYLVHDTVTAAGTAILSFNAHRLRMIASSRKKTDRRDAYWIAKALAAGMYPLPVYIPTGAIRELRALLSRRRMVHADRSRWQYRARAYLRGAGYRVGPGSSRLRAALERERERGAGRAGEVALREALGLCQRQEAALALELKTIDAEIHARPRQLEAIRQLMTVPGIGELVATTIYAWVGDVRRFPNAKALASYAGLVPSVRQSAASQRFGPITKEGSNALRATLVQAAHVVMNCCRTAGARPLQAIGARVQTSRRRRKIAAVALARHLLRVGYCILRDGTTYDPARLRGKKPEAATAA